MNDDLYEILGVSRDADTAEIKKAYREKARKYHPDVNPDDPESEEKFKKASAAFEVLGNEKKREIYDEFGLDGLREGFDPEEARKYKQWQQASGAGGGGFGGFGGGGGRRRTYRGGGASGADFEDIFGDIFGGGTQSPFGGGQGFGGGFGGVQTPVKGRDISASLELDFVRAIEGGEMQLALQGRSKPLKVRVPAGVRDGERLRLKGKGGPAPQTPQGQGEPGDLFLEISVGSHPRVRRKGLNLYMDVPITMPEAIEGTTINVPTPWGEYSVSVPEGVNSGAKLRLKGQGVHRGDDEGDFYVVIQINAPDRIDDSVRQALDDLADGYEDDVRAEVSWT